MSDRDLFEEIAAKCQALTRKRPAAPRLGADLEEAREIGFSCRLLVQATLPHSKPDPSMTEFERSNGLVTVRIQAPRPYGLPYGTYPRLLLAWLTTEAVRTKKSELELGDSLRGFMRKLDLNEDGRSLRLLRAHMQRLFSSTVSAVYQDHGQLIDVGFRPIEGMCLFWNPKTPDQRSLWQSTIRLNQTFFEEITRRPVPVDMAALRKLSRSPMALDLYAWLTHRMSYLRKPTTVPWESLALQFGGNYGRLRDFKAGFLARLKQVLEIYSQAKVEPAAGGLLLRPSRTHVPLLTLQSGQ